MNIFSNWILGRKIDKNHKNENNHFIVLIRQIAFVKKNKQNGAHFLE